MHYCITVLLASQREVLRLSGDLISRCHRTAPMSAGVWSPPLDPHTPACGYRFVALERPLWAERRRALVQNRSVALPHGRTLTQAVAHAPSPRLQYFTDILNS